MKKRLIASICAAVVAVTAVTGAVVLRNDYDVFMIVESEGRAVADDTMLRILTDEDMNVDDSGVKELQSEPVAASDTIYERGGKLYLGEDKKQLSFAYPFFVNNGTAVFCINESAMAVTDEFDFVPTYQGLYISEGISFNQDMERAYREDFLFLHLSNGLFLNTMELTVNKSDLPGNTLASNSVLTFYEDEVRYFSLDENGVFRLTSVTGLTEESFVRINGKEYDYYDLLERLGIYEKEVLFEEVVKATLTPAPTPTAKVNPKPTITPTPTVTKTPATPGVSEGGADDEGGTGSGQAGTITQDPTRPNQDKITPTPTVAPSPVPGEEEITSSPRPTPGQTPEGGENITPSVTITPTLDTNATPRPTPGTKPTREPRPTSTPAPTPTPRPTLTPMPPLTAAPAEPSGSSGEIAGSGEPAPPAPTPAQPAPPADPEPSAPAKPVKPSDPGATVWVKPTVKLTGPFSSLVYSVTHNSLEVTNAEFLHKSGITFEVQDPETGKLVTRKAYAASNDDIRISGLRPNATYKIVVTMNYVDAKGNRRSELVREGDIVTTLGTEHLDALLLNWSNGPYLYTNKAELFNIQIKDFKENDKFYLDMIQHIAKVELAFEPADKSIFDLTSDTEIFRLNQKSISNLKLQEAVDFVSPERLESNTEYIYTFSVTDKYGEAFRLGGTYSGTISTAKEAPVAKFKVTKNEVKDIELEINIDNPDKADLENTYFRLKDSAGTNVVTSAYLNGTFSQSAGYHLLTAEKTKVRFTDLIDFEVYTVEVYTDYDVADNKGMQIDKHIGQTKVITASITSLGQAYFGVSFDAITDNSAVATVQLNSNRTNSRLQALIDEYDISFVKVTRNEEGEEIGTSSEGIVVQYVAKEKKEELPEDSEGGSEESGLPEEGGAEEAGIMLLGEDGGDAGDSGDSGDTGDVGDTGENEGSEGTEELPEEIPGEADPMDVMHKVENGTLTLYEYQLEDIHGSGIRFVLSNLDSVSEYRISIVPRVFMGSERNVPREIRTSFTPDSFYTLMEMPYISIDSAYVSGNRIRLFGLSVTDRDGAVLEYPLTIQVYDEFGTMVKRMSYAKEELTDGNKVKEIIIEPLNRYREYTVRFFVTKFNDVLNGEEFEINKELYYEPYVDSEELLKFTTGEAVVGDLNFEGLSTYKVVDHQELKVDVAKQGSTALNVFTPYARKAKQTSAYSTKASDITNTYIKWEPMAANSNRQEAFNRYVPQSGKGAWGTIYKATVDFGTGNYNSMSVGYTHSSGGTPIEIRLYAVDPVANPDAKPLAVTVLDGTKKTFNNYALRWLDIATFAGTEGLTGVQDVYLEYECTDPNSKINIGGFSGVIFRNIQEAENPEKTFFANIAVNVNDTKGQLGALAKYRLKIYKNGVLTDMQEHEYTSMNGVPAKTLRIYDILTENDQPAYVETVKYEADDYICDTDFYYEVERNAAKGNTYKFELLAYIDGYEITLDEISFESKEPVYEIRTREDFSKIPWDLTGSYVVLNDINFGTWQWAHTGLTSGVFFEGNLDFQGHTITLNNVYAPIYNLGTNGVIENVVVKHAETFNGNSTAVLVYNNYGTIRNVVYEKNTPNPAYSYQNKYGLITYNRHSGVLENFIIHFVDDWYVGQYAGAVSYINWGTVRNGYTYGKAVRYIPKELMDSTQRSQSNYVSTLVSVNRVGGTIENCYTLNDIYSSMPYRTDVDHFNFFTASNRGLVQNCFSVGNVYYKKDAESSTDMIKANVNPLYSNASSGGIAEAERMYLYSDQEYDRSSFAQMLLEKASLHDEMWYRNLFDNKEQVSKIKQFNISVVNQGFYPQLIMPDSMPEQDWILLPQLVSGEKTEVLHAEVTEQNVDTAYALVSFYNPNRIPVQTLTIEHFEPENVQILEQYEDGDFWRVKIKVSGPKKYFSEYAILGFSMGTSKEMISYSKVYSERDAKKVGFEFFCPVNTVMDWMKINNDLTQNYRLYNNLDFAFQPMKNVYIGNGSKPLTTNSPTWASYQWNFTGKLDGNGKTIRNLDLDEYGGLFESLYGGTIMNLTVENLDLEEDSQDNPVNLRRALVRNMGKDSVLDNVHVLGVKITGTEYSGGLVAYAHSGRITVKNCSVHDCTITTTNINTGSTQYIGGIMALASGEVICSITNSYVDGLQLKAELASAVGGIGGIVGRITSGCTLENLYVTDSKISSFFQYTGGIAGSIISQTYADGYILRNVYVDADISSLSDILGGLIGYAQQVNNADQINALFLGDVYMRNEEFNYVSRYIGYQSATTKLVKEGLYTFKEASHVNGRLNNEDRDDSDTRKNADPYVYVTREDLCNPEFYTNGIKIDGVFRNLDLGESFALSYTEDLGEGRTQVVTYAEKGMLPLLYATDGVTLLPYQEEHSLENIDVQVTKIVTTPDPSRVDLSTVKISVTHPEGYTVKEFSFDENVKVAEGPTIVSLTPTTSEVEYKLLAQGFVDRYYITGIKCVNVLGEEVTIQLQLDSLMQALFKDINNAAEWNEFMNVYGDKGYNIRISGDLDFTGQTAYRENVTVNRMLGGFLEEDDWVKITGINRATNNPFIDTAYGRISNIKFENIELEKINRDKTKNFGIIGHAAGNVSDVRFTDIVIDSSYRDEGTAGRHGGGYANHVALISMLSGAASNVKIDGVYVQADATGVTSTNTTSAFVGYANSTASFHNVEAKNISILSGDRYYTGGIVGYMNGATKLTGITLSDFAIFANVDAGGVAGYAAAATYGRTLNDITVKDGLMIGRVRVGGVIGQGYLVNSTDALPSVVDNVFVMGDYHVGGVVGIGGASRNVTVKNSDIYGSYRVGGIVGYGNALATHCVDSTISSVWARTDTATTNDLYQAAVTARKDAVAEKLSDASLGAFERRTLENAKTYLEVLLKTSNTGLDWRYMIYNKFSGTPSANKLDQDARIGGISGMGQLFENNVVTNCTIGNITAEEVGGIVGHHVNVGYDTWSRTSRVFSNASMDSTVTGATNVGGIIGVSKRYLVSNNYSNATVSAVVPSKVTINGAGTNAGGIVGSINKTATYSLAETPRVYSCYFAGTVSANDYVAGIIGRCYQDVYGDNRDLLVTGTVQVTSDSIAPHIQFIANRIANPSNGFVESAVYEDAMLRFGTAGTEITAVNYYNGIKQDAVTGLTPEQQKLADDVSLVTSAQLQNKEFYSKVSGSVKTGFTTNPEYWNFNGLVNGYMPYITYRIYYGDNTAGNSPVRYQEGYTVNANGEKTYNYKTYNGGVPIPGYVAPVRMMMRRPVQKVQELPTMTAYCVDADKLNLEFSAVNSAALYTVTANGKTVAEGTVSGRVLTLEYDYRTSLTVTVEDGKESCEYTITPQNVARNVMVYGNDYYYVTPNGIEGSAATIAGNFVSLYNGKALTADGTLYDVTTGLEIGKAKAIGVAKEGMPLAEFTYEDYTVLLYHGFSVTAGMERDGMRLYVKNGCLFAVDCDLTPDADAVILDTLKGELTTVLANNSTIIDLTDTGIVLPKNFENSKISQMTNNLDTYSTIVLVRYKDGGVIGFDYRSGEVVVDTGRSGSSGNTISGSVTETTAFGMTAAGSYKNVQSFENNLITSGWTPAINSSGTTSDESGKSSTVNGSSAISGTATGNGDASISGTNTDAGSYIGNGSNSGNGIYIGAGENTIGGTYIEDGTGSESTSGDEAQAGSQTMPDDKTDADGQIQTGIDSDENGEYQSGSKTEDNTELGNKPQSGKEDKVTEGTENESTDLTAGNGSTAGSGTTTGNGNVSGIGEITGNDSTASEAGNQSGTTNEQQSGTSGDDKDEVIYQNEYTEVRPKEGIYGITTGEAKYIPFFDAELNEYVLFDEAELLTASQNELTSMNEKVKLSGHMIDRHTPFVDDIGETDSGNRNGIILMLLTVAGVAMLLCILIYKHQNGGKANEED